MHRKLFILTLFATSQMAGTLFAQQNPVSKGLALTPPMGWNTWNKFACNVSDELVRGMADAMVKSGMRDAGYQYIVIDDCWQVSRDANGNIVVDQQRFPSGMKAVADYVHSVGLKFGIYSDAGAMTCQKRPAGLGHEYQDARTYASWGVDYLKYDWCNTLPGQDARSSYANIRQALDASGHPIVLSICEWGTAKPWLWGKEVGGNLWRTTGDIQDRWAGKKEWSPGNCCSNGMLDIVDENAELYSYAGPGHWNDPDMLEVGNGGMNEDEYRTHFSLWAILAAPLIAGNDLTKMTPYTVAILTNREVIAVDQDPLGKQGFRVTQEGPFEVWMKPMADGSKVVGLFNRQRTIEQMAVTFSQIGISGEASVRDLWLKRGLGRFKDKYSAYVPAHGVVLIRVKPQ